MDVIQRLTRSADICGDIADRFAYCLPSGFLTTLGRWRQQPPEGRVSLRTCRRDKTSPLWRCFLWRHTGQLESSFTVGGLSFNLICSVRFWERFWAVRFYSDGNPSWSHANRPTKSGESCSLELHFRNFHEVTISGGFSPVGSTHISLLIGVIHFSTLGYFLGRHKRGSNRSVRCSLSVYWSWRYLQTQDYPLG